MSKENKTLCPGCGHSVRWFWNYCPRCAAQLREDVKILTAEQIRDLQSEIGNRSGDSKHTSQEG